MSYQSRLKVISFGKGASTTDFTSTPSLTRLLPEKEGFFSPSRKDLRRAPIRDTGKQFVPVAGPKDMDRAYPLEQIVTGLSGNTGATIASSTTSEIGQVLDCLLGAAVDPANAVTTSTGGVGATPTLLVTSGADIPNGMVVGFATTGAFVGTQWRQVVSGGGTGALTLDRTYVGTVTNGANVIRTSRWKVDPSTHMHTPAYFRAENNDGAGWRRDFFGGFGTWSIDAAIGEYLRLMSSWRFTDVTDVAEENPTITEPTRGTAIVNVNSSLYIGSTVFMARDLKIDGGGVLSPRMTTNGPHGIQGYVIKKGPPNPPPKISGKLYLGSGGSTFGEIDDSAGTPSVNAAQAWDKNPGDAFATFDVALQFGNAAAGLLYSRAPAAAFTKADVVEIDGLEMLDFELECYGPASGFPLDIALG